jgi:hypothetical protein
MKKTIFAPGCGLMLYKPEIAGKLHQILNKIFGHIEILDSCCHHDPRFDKKVKVINVCPGCDKRYRNNYENTTTISLWEVLAECDFYNFPNYNGMKMSIIDACPTRDQERVHIAIRKLLSKMNIETIEPTKTRNKSTCCGDSFYGVLPTEEVILQMKKRTAEMPVDHVVVYCVSCIKSVFNGGKQPRYLPDLLLAENTFSGTSNPDQWHKELDDYIALH